MRASDLSEFSIVLAQFLGHRRVRLLELSGLHLDHGEDDQVVVDRLGQVEQLGVDALGLLRKNLEEQT